MKRAISLLICALAIIVIYDFLMISGLQSTVPFSIGETIVIVIASIFLTAGIADGYHETHRYITRPKKAIYSAMDSSI